jgi:hypothetical protein
MGRKESKKMKEITVNVKSMNGQALKVTGVYNESTLQELIDRVATHMQLANNQITLVAAGKALNDIDLNKTLEQLGIDHNSTVFCILRLVG